MNAAAPSTGARSTRAAVDPLQQAVAGNRVLAGRARTAAHRLEGARAFDAMIEAADALERVARGVRESVATWLGDAPAAAPAERRKRAPLVPIPIPAGSPADECRGCGAVMYWAPHPTTGRPHPVSIAFDGARAPSATEPGEGHSHFSDCPKADRFRGRK